MSLHFVTHMITDIGIWRHSKKKKSELFLRQVTKQSAQYNFIVQIFLSIVYLYIEKTGSMYSRILSVFRVVSK